MKRNRVVISGMGIMAPNGKGVRPYWDSLCKGVSGIREVSLFDTATFPRSIAGEVPDFRLEAHVPSIRHIKRLSRQSQLALAAAQEAVESAGLTPEDLRRHSSALLLAIGVSTSSFDMFEKGKEQLMARGPQRVNPFMIGAGQPNATAGALMEFWDLSCACFTLSTACTAGLDAVILAAQRVAEGSADWAVAGGTDAFVSPLGVAGFFSSGMTARWEGPPEKASRPFDRDRKGGILSEGAAFLFLERLESALARGVLPLAEFVGQGTSVDRGQTEAGAGFPEAMGEALANACCLPGDIDYVCANGPSDPTIDRVETAALRQVLNGHAYRIPVTSIKGCTGNPLSAAGPMQLIAATKVLQTGLVPPTANYEHADPDCDLDYVPGQARRQDVRQVLIDMHGLGGRNTCAVLRKAGR